MQTQKMVRAIVAKGRSLDIGHPTDKKIIGIDANGAPRTMAVITKANEGDVVDLPSSEVALLVRAGFLLDPTVTPPPVDENSDVLKPLRDAVAKEGAE